MQRVETCVLPPGLCFICETTPQEGDLVVDTGRNFYAAAPTNLDGRKYLCGGCISSAGKQIGLASDEALNKAAAERDIALGRLAALRDRCRALASELSEEILNKVELAAPVVAAAASVAAETAAKPKPKAKATA
jgi:hypothetical protein